MHLLHVVFTKLSSELRALLLAERAHPRQEYSQVKMEVLLFWESSSNKTAVAAKKEQAELLSQFYFLRNI